MQVERTGTRVAALRKLRGLSQRQLAAQAHISYSLLTKVESGHAPATPAFIGAVARALRVDVPRLTGQPYQPPGHSSSARLADALEPVRLAVASFDYPDTDAAPRPLDELAEDVRRLSDDGQRADYAAIGARLPTLLAELSIALASCPAEEQPRLQALLAEAYSGVSSLANLLGLQDFRDRIVDKIQAASEACDDPLRVARVQWQRGQSMMVIGAYGPGLRMLDQARADLGEDFARMNPKQLSVYGSLHLKAAVLASRAAQTEGSGRVREAWEHIDAAQEIADRIGQDRNDYGLAFGPSNVVQHGVSVAVELEDGPEAIRRGQAARLGPTVPAVRRSHHYIDLGRAYAMEGRSKGALRCLQQARRIAPQQTRHHPQVRETVMTVASGSNGGEELRRFADWLGIS